MKTGSLTEVPIADVRLGPRYRRDLGDLAPLERSVAAVGLLQPIGITPDKQLIFGERRLRACESLGWKTVTARVINIESIVRGEHDENSDEIRKAFTNSEKLAIAKALKEEMGERRGRPSKEAKGAESCTNSPTSKGEKTRDVTAKAAGFKNHEEMRLAEIVEKHCPQDVRDAVDDETVSLSDAAKVAHEPHALQEAALQKVIYREAPTLAAAVKMAKDDHEDAEVDDEPILDLLGNPVPEHLMHFVEDSVLCQEIQQDAKALRLKLDALDKRPLSSRRAAGQLQTNCKAIERAMVAERFGFVCPSCKGSSAVPCKCCQGRRWFVAGDKDKVTARRAS